MTNREYWDEVDRIRENIQADWDEDKRHGIDRREDAGHWRDEAIDAALEEHKYVTTYAQTWDVMRYTRNQEAYFDATGHWPPDNSFDMMLVGVAFMAMSEDVRQGLELRLWDE